MKTILCIPAALLLAAAITACNHPKTNMTTEKPAVHNNGVNIAYIDTGVHDTTLLFVHGWAINKGYWKNQINNFAGKYRVVAIDLPGFGASGKNRNSWDTKAYASDVDSVIRELGLKNVVLVGHSMAGDIVLQSAINNPDKVIGVVGVDNFKGVGVPSKPEDKKGFASAIDSMKHHFKKTANFWFNQMLFSKTTADSIKTRILNDVAKTDSVIAVAALSNYGDFDELAKVKDWKKKLYLINSDYTPTDTTYLNKSKLPFKLFNIHSTGHFPMVEDPIGFNAAMGQVMKDLQKK